MIKKTATEARQGTRGKRVLIVLSASLVIAAALAITAASVFPDVENAEVLEPVEQNANTTPGASG